VARQLDILKTVSSWHAEGIQKAAVQGNGIHRERGHATVRSNVDQELWRA